MTPLRPLPTWRYMVQMARYRPWLYLLHAVSWGVMDMSSLLPGLIARAFFDTLTGRAYLPVGTRGLIGLLMVIGAGQAALWLIAGFVEITMRFTMSGLVRRNLLRHVLERPGAQALPFSIGESISRFRDDAYEAEDNMDWTDEIVVHGLFALVAFLVLLHIDARMTLVAFLPLVLVVAAARRASTALDRYRAASSQATSQVTGAIGDILAAVQTVQAAGAEARAVAHFRRLNKQRRRAMLADRLLTQALDAITANTVSVGTGLIMLLAAGSLRAGSLTVGDFVLFVSYLGVIADFTDGLGQYLAHFRQTGVAFARMDVLLGGAPPAALVAHIPLHLRGPLPTVPPQARHVSDRLVLVEARGLTYRHPQSGRGIDAVDLRLPRGTLTVVTARARPLCCAPCLACCLPWQARSGGTATSWLTQPLSWCRPAPRTRRRCPACSARRSSKTSCWGYPTTLIPWTPPCGAPSWNRTCRRWRPGWRRRWARAASSSPAARCSARRRHACWRAAPNCW